MSSSLDQSVICVGVIGAGKMGQMLIESFLRCTLPESKTLKIMASTSSERTLTILKTDPRFHSISFSLDNHEIAKKACIIFLCVKPNQIDSILWKTPNKSCGSVNLDPFRGILVSICAGISFQQLKSVFTCATNIIRCIPSITSSCASGEGLYILAMTRMKGSVSGYESDGQIEAMVTELLKPSGRLIWVSNEKELDIATALGASGPAFASIFLEGLTDGAVQGGLSRALAYEIGAQMMKGTSQLVLEGQHPAIIKDKVSTPAGCTIDGILHLEAKGFRGIAAGAISSAIARINNLSNKHP